MMWRKLRWVLLGLFVLVVILIALPFVIPTGVYKAQIIEQARIATGRELKIDGDLKISFWPSLGVEVGRVTFGNASGAADSSMAAMETLVVGAELWPLLSGSLKVTELKLVNPIIHLEIDKNGHGNWLFASAPDAPKTTKVDPSKTGGELSFRDVELSGGVLTYRDARTGTAQTIEAINASVTLPNLDQPMTLSGGLTWNKQAIRIDAEISNPRALSQSGESDLKAKIEGDVLTATFDGVARAATNEMAGKVALRTVSARRLTAWAGVELPKGPGFGAMQLTGDLVATTGRIAFTRAKLSLDGMNGSGNLALETNRARPYVRGNFTLDRLNLNSYLNGNARAKARTGSGVQPWSGAAIDFSPLRFVDADLDFAVNALSAGGMRTGRGALNIALAGGKLRAHLRQLALYGGTGTGVISLNGATGVPEFGLEMMLTGIQAEPFLTDAADFSRLSGTGTITARVAGAGKSQRAWMQSLRGSARFKFEDGAIKGVNLAEIARTIQSALTGSAVGAASKTDFAELSGSFAIKSGVAANKDLKLLNPFVRLNGSGTVDIGNQSLDYRLEPKAVGSMQGQGGVHDIAGIGIPFLVKGPWSNPSYSPDLSGVLNSAVDAILGDPKSGRGLGDLFPELSAGKPQQEGEPSPKNDPNKKPNPLDPLKGLFGQ